MEDGSPRQEWRLWEIRSFGDGLGGDIHEEHHGFSDLIRISTDQGIRRSPSEIGIVWQAWLYWLELW